MGTACSQDEETEVEEATMALLETGEGTTFREEDDQSSGTEDSHRRCRMLAARHKDHIGEDEGDGHCLMAMGRDISSRSSSSSHNPVPGISRTSAEGGGIHG